MKDPDFRGVENIHLTSLGLKESALTLDLHYYNPNNSRLRLKKAEGEAWLEGNFLGHFTVDTLVLIPANGDFELPVKLQVDMSKAIQNSAAVLFNQEVMVKIEGKARVGKAGFFINYPIHYEGKQNLSELLNQ